MKIIHCSVWGDIEVSDMAIQIIDTRHFQRLHYIKQTGFAYKVFPTATSSRFEHSIGVYHTTRSVFNEIQRKQPEACPDPRVMELVCIAGLVHDLGHGPFSHLFDDILTCIFGKEDPWTRHEFRGQLIFRDLVSVYRIPLTPEEIDFVVARMDHPPEDQWFDTLVCNPASSLDTDKMDYVLRDARHFGLKCNADISRIWRNMRVIDNRLCFCDKVQDEIDLFFRLREKMHRTIYRHPKIEYFQSHFLVLTREHATDALRTLSLDGFLSITDHSMFQMIPREKWVVVETRRAPAITMETRDFRDDQWRRARENILYYSKKDPSTSFRSATVS